MAIKINWNDLQKRFIGGTEILRVYKSGYQVRPDVVPPTPTPVSLCFTANTSNSTISFNYSTSGNSRYFEYSTDWTTWSDYTIAHIWWAWTTLTLSNVWDKVYFRSKSDSVTSLSGVTWLYKFTMTWSIAASWDVTSLLCKTGATTLSNYCFYRLFDWCTALTSAPSLTATTLGENCYREMFRNCTNLVTPPSTLTSTTAPYGCCYGMFYGCSSMTSAPTLPATTLWVVCYNSMFYGCTSLVYPPALPATTLATQCYLDMFYGCTSLITIAALPATTLANYCYGVMYGNCSRIKVSETQSIIYRYEFRIPTTWTGTSATWAMDYMFSNTWGSFTWTPTINTTYYTMNPIIS